MLCAVVWTYVACTGCPRRVDQVVRRSRKDGGGSARLHRRIEGGGAIRIGSLLDDVDGAIDYCQSRYLSNRAER